MLVCLLPKMTLSAPCKRALRCPGVTSEIDTSVSSTRKTFNFSMKKSKDNALVGNTGHFVIEFGLPGSKGLEGMKVDNITPQKISRRPRRSGSCWLHVPMVLGKKSSASFMSLFINSVMEIRV